jgi:hypothetical protein
MEIQYRVLWTEKIGGRKISFSGPVRESFEDVEYCRARYAELPRHSRVMIEARQKSGEAWPLPSDGAVSANEATPSLPQSRGERQKGSSQC